MSKLKFKLIKKEKALTLQTEFIATELNGKLDYTAENGVVLRSNKTTDLNASRDEFISNTDNRIYFGGKVKSKAHKVAVRHYASNRDRDIAYDEIMVALKDWKNAGFPVCNNPSNTTTECPCEVGTFSF